MASRTIEIIGRYEGERYRFENANGEATIIGSVKLQNDSKEIAEQHGVADPHGSVAIKGEDDSTLNPNSTYRFLGTFASYQNRRTGQSEKQFHFRTFVSHVPHDPEGIANYLVDNGRGNGIGPAKARRLVAKFGVEEVLRICRQEPETIAAFASIDLDSAKRFSQKLESQKATENAKLELEQLLAGKGFPRTLVGRLIKEFGNKAAAVITEDPYQLMQFRGVGFRLADKLYMELRLDPFAVDRQALCLWYSMASNTEGHCWFSAERQVQQLRAAIGPKADYRAAILRGREFGKLGEDHYGAIASIRTDGNEGGVCESGNTLWLSEGRVASQERRLAELITAALNENTQQTITIYNDFEFVGELPASVARCNRCGRALTAEIVHVVDGKPYGPTCVERVGV